MLAFRFEVERFGLTEGKTRGSSLRDGERRFLLSWGPQRPFCTACGALLDLTNAPPGADGDLPCACGAMTSTFPPPPWLSKADPAVLQVFGAPRQSSASVAQAATNASRPIGFVCSDCGANLKVNSESARILRCSFCQSDSFIPDPLWRALHPVKKRTPYVLAFR